jgi:V8-like Glu-specific endopeptidase
MATDSRRVPENTRPSRSRVPKGAARLTTIQLDRSEPLQRYDDADHLGIREALATGDAPRGLYLSRGRMTETFGGGSLENVPGYDVSRAMTSGIAFEANVSWPQLGSPPATPPTADFKPESVIGPVDTRRPVPNTTVVPWRCVALLRMEYADKFVGRGTGWFIAPQTLVTAAHNVHDRIHGPAQRIVVTPGFHQGAAPFKQALVVAADLNPGWARAFTRELDFALIFIPQSLGVGFFGFSAASDQGLRNVLVNISGYPIDRPFTQMYDAGRISDVDSNFLYHTIDTEGGQSGAPIFWSDRDSRIGLGIHTYGASGVDPTNVARRITPDLFALFQQRKR